MILAALKQYVDWHAGRVFSSMMDPRAAQQRVFHRLRRVLHGSEVAARSGFDRCETLEDCRGLPPSNHTVLKPLFQQAFEEGAAASHLFGRSRIVGFARTSGTLGEPKDIPLTRASMASLDRTLVRMAATHVHTGRQWDTLLSGRRILLGSRPVCGASPTGLPIGDISGIIPTRTWRTVRWAFIPRHRDLWVQEWPHKADAILQQARGKNVVSISAIPALAMDLAARTRDAYGSTLGEAWPNLRQYVYGAVRLSAEQKEDMRRAWMKPGATLNFYETYFATEGALAFSYEPDVDGLALNSLENLYLFRSQPGGKFLFAHELVPGDSCSLHVTTPGGLVNYAMGDRVEVVSQNPLRIRVVGREAEELSLTGEKITLAQVELALEAAGLGPLRYGATLPVVWIEDGEKPHLVWAIPEGGADAGCARLLDEALCRLNVLYSEALVQEGVIGHSRVLFLPAAAFQSHRPSTLGSGQFKHRRLFSSRQACLAEYPLAGTRTS
jgi:hypothetical protein